MHSTDDTPDDNGLRDSGGSRVGAMPQVPFSLVRDCVVVQLIDNFDQQDLEVLEHRILQQLCEGRRLRGIILNFNEVQTTDLQDLQRLHALLQAIHLVGCRVGLCGINPGLAIMMARSGLPFRQERIAAGIDELLDALLAIRPWSAL